MTLEPATPDAIFAVASKMRERDRQEFAAVSGAEDTKAIAVLLRQRYGRRGMLCARHDGMRVCIGGSVSVRPGVATLLFFATEAFPAIALPMTRFIKRHYFPSLAAEGVHRIECVTLATYSEMHRWLETLGMVKEGLFRGYGKHGEDFVPYAWVSDVRPSGP